MDAPPVQYVTTSDGYNIAYCVSGQGPPLVCISPNFHDTRQLWLFYPRWMEGLASRFTVIQYDPRGEGMSTRGLPNSLTQADYVSDLEAVVGRLQVKRFSIWALGGRTHTAIRYAVKHRERIESLLLTSPAASGRSWQPGFWVMLPNEGWERFLRAVVPAGLSIEETRARMREYQRTVTLEDWNAYMQCMEASDVGPELEGLPVPVLVMHARDSLLADIPDGPMKLAASLPNGRFVSLDGEYFGDTATQALGAIDTFMVEVSHRQGIRRLLPQSGVTEPVLSSRELEVLRLVAAGKSNAQIADELVISQNTVIRHVSNIFAKTGVANRAEATSYAHRHGVV